MEILVYVLYNLIQIYVYIMVVYILLSWTPLYNSKFGRILGNICDPYLNIFRGKLVAGNIDFGAVIGILLLQVILMYLGTLV